MAEIQGQTTVKTPVFLKADEIKAKAEENKKQRALPTKPGDNVGFKDLKNWLALLTPEMTDDNRIIVYVYRYDPVIIRQNVDPDADNNIDVVSDGFSELTEQYFIDTHGGGKYGLVVKDQDNPKQGKNGFFTATLTIPMSQYPPNLDLREVDWTHKNNKGFRAWARAKKLIDDNNVPIEQGKSNNLPQQQTQSNDSMIPVFKMMMDFVDKMSQKDQQNIRKQLGAEDSLGKSIGELLLERMKQDDPNKQVATITTLMSAMNKGGSDIATIMPMFLAMMNSMMEASKNQMTMMMQMFQNQNQGKGEEKDEISRLKDLLEVARELKGGNSSSNKSQVTEWIEAGAPVLQSAFNLLSNVVAAKATANGQGVQPQVNKTEPNKVTQQQQTQQTQQQQTTLPTGNEAAAIINNFKPIILNKLAQEGWEFGVWIEEGFGAMQAAAITKYGVEGLLAAAKTVPDFWQQIEQSYGEAHMRKWLESLVNYKEIVAKLEAEDDKEEE